MELDILQKDFFVKAVEKERYAEAMYLGLYSITTDLGAFKAAAYFKAAAEEEAEHVRKVIDTANKYKLRLDIEALPAFSPDSFINLPPAMTLKIMAQAIEKVESTLFSFYTEKVEDKVLAPFALEMQAIQLDAMGETADLVRALELTEDAYLLDKIYEDFTK